MKNRHEFLTILMLLTLLLFSTYAYAQRNPQRDLSVGWRTNREAGEPGIIMGDLVNKSSNTYPCVRIEFDLYTRFDKRQPGEESRHLGVLPASVQNLPPRTVLNFKQPLPYPAGIGLKSISECSGQPNKPVPGLITIVSFTVTPQSIQAGQSATLRWRTENTDSVIVGVANPEATNNPSAAPILMPRNLGPSGSLEVTPSRTTSYRLKARQGPDSRYAHDVTVTVTNPTPTSPPPAAFCSISGRISNDRRDYATRVGLHRPDDFKRSLFSTAVGIGGRYSFPRVPVGDYNVVPRGRYPSSKLDIGPIPSAQRITCRPNGSHRADFTIGSNEG